MQTEKILFLFLMICQQGLSQSMFRSNPELTGVVQAADINQVKAVKFIYKAGGAIRSTPALADGLVYFGGTDGLLYAIDAAAGNEKWKFKTNGAITSSPAVANGVVWFTSRDGYFYALQAKSGNELWKFRMGADLNTTESYEYWDYYLSSPVIVGDNIYVGGGDGVLYAFNCRTKKNLWKYNAGVKIRTSPAVTGSGIVAGTMDGHIICLNLADGSLKWKFATDGASNHFINNDRTSITCSPAVQDGVIVVGGRDSFVYGIDLETGTKKWKITHDSSSWILSTAIAGGNAFIGSGSAAIVQATDLKTGKETWRFKTKSGVFSSIAVTGRNLYFADFSGSVYGVDRETGREKWEFNVGSRIFSTPMLSDGIVYFGADNGFLYALQGSAEEPAVKKASRKIVYWKGPESDSAFLAFQLHTDMWLREYFVGAGYELMNTKQLVDFMQGASASPAPSVVVFADNKIPSEIVEEYSENCLLRKYLNAGGKTVVFGDNPLAYKLDPRSGVFKGQDFKRAGKVLGVTFLERKYEIGYYPSSPTEEGKKYGLYDFWTGTGSTVANDPAITALTANEFGRSTSWIKNYGGPSSSGWMQFNINNLRGIIGNNINQLRTAIERGLEW